MNHTPEVRRGRVAGMWGGVGGLRGVRVWQTSQQYHVAGFHLWFSLQSLTTNRLSKLLRAISMLLLLAFNGSPNLFCSHTAGTAGLKSIS